MSVKVAVRVRPFSQREIDLKSKKCVEMNNRTTILIDDNENVKDFTFDYSFWSHDGFEISETGYAYPITEKYAD